MIQVNIKKVYELSLLKYKNERALTEDELNGKYKKAYDELCEKLKTSQCELRTEYVKIINTVLDLMSESIYLQYYDSEEYWEQIKELVNKSAKSDIENLLLRNILYTFIGYLGTALNGEE